MEAKRAARAAARGFDLAWVNRQLEEFVARQGDMQASGGAAGWVPGHAAAASGQGRLGASARRCRYWASHTSSWLLAEQHRQAGNTCWWLSLSTRNGG